MSDFVLYKTGVRLYTIATLSPAKGECDIGTIERKGSRWVYIADHEARLRGNRKAVAHTLLALVQAIRDQGIREDGE